MSRTDAHVPYYVRLLRDGVESHDHSRGYCDLKPNDSVSALRSSRRYGNHYKVCKKNLRYLVTCEHIVSRRYDLFAEEVKETISYKPHQILSVWDYSQEKWIQAHWDFPESLEVCYYHDPFSSVRLRRRSYDMVPMHRTHANFTQHEYIAFKFDKTIPCSCDEKNIQMCDYVLHDPIRGYCCGCYYCSSENRNEKRYGSRRAVRQDLKAQALAWNMGEDLD